MEAMPILLATLPLLQQSPASVARASRAHTAGANVKHGVVASVDASSGALTISSRGGTRVSFRIGDRTQVWLNRRKVAVADLLPGSEVVVRHRQSDQAPHLAYDVADSATWTWLQRIRRDVTTVRVSAVEEGWLRTEEGAERNPVEYRWTGKTAWSRGGKAVGPEAFRPGDTASVAPRLLPNGAVMAVSVAENPDSAARLRERSRPTVTGVVTRYDAASRSLALRTVLGDERDLTLAEACECRRDGRTVPLTALRAGTRVTAHLRTESDGVRRCVKVTVQREPRAPTPGSHTTKR